MAWILVAVLLVVAASLALALLRQRTALNAEVVSAGNLRRERDAAKSANQALDARLAGMALLDAEPARRAPDVATDGAEAGPEEAGPEPPAESEPEAGGMPAESEPEAGGMPAESEPEADAPPVTDADRSTDNEPGPAPELAPAADPAPAAGPVGADERAPVEARLAALWALAQIEQQRTWRLSMATAIDGDPGLAGALAMEVDRIREDVGTPGLLETRLDSPVAVHDAALALLAARELLAALVPHTQAYDMAVGHDGAHLAIEVVCTGWEGPAEAADDVSRLLAAIAPAGGNLSLDTDPDGRLRATLQLPLTG